MAAKEEREYRNVSKKLAGVEERAKLLDELKRRKMGDLKGVVKKQHEEIVSLSNKYKIKDNSQLGVKLHRRRNWLRGRLELTLGKSV